MSIAARSLQFCESFEAELLLELMLRQWRHPLCDDSDFRNDLLECATNVLQSSVQGEKLMDDLVPDQMNFVAAVFYAEHVTLDASGNDVSVAERRLREEWLERVRRTVPSCFCNQDDIL